MKQNLVALFVWAFLVASNFSIVNGRREAFSVEWRREAPALRTPSRRGDELRQLIKLCFENNDINANERLKRWTRTGNDRRQCNRREVYQPSADVQRSTVERDRRRSLGLDRMRMLTWARTKNNENSRWNGMWQEFYSTIISLTSARIIQTYLLRLHISRSLCVLPRTWMAVSLRSLIHLFPI